MKNMFIGFGLATICAVVACGGNPGDSACDHAQQCAQQSGDVSFSVTQCKVQVQEEMDKASNAGCLSQADVLASCMATMPCEGFADDTVLQANCGAALKALNKCMAQ